MRLPTSLLLFLLCAAAPTMASDARPLIRTYCVQCHNADTQEGGLDLTTILSGDAAKEFPKLLAKAKKRVDAGEMPPEDAKQPTPAERAEVVRWLGGTPVVEAAVSVTICMPAAPRARCRLRRWRW